jgi:3-hydroxybutyryl-CoA dehydrogenase
LVKIVVAGPGLMGSQIGCEWALAGHDVTFLVNRPAEAERRIATAFDLIGTLGLWPADAVAAAPSRMSNATGFEQIEPGVDLILESIAEDAEAKIDLLKAAAERFPDAILASNTSAIPITILGEGSGAPERMIGMHYWNPPLLMPLVEVISGERTSAEIFDRAAEMVRSIGKSPILVKKDVPGFVWNRMQLAMLREAMWIVENDVATPEVVDQVMRDGLARRWRFTGPFQTAALGGPVTFAKIADNLWPELSAETAIGDLGRFLETSPERLSEIRETRDAGLLRELQRERKA